MRIRLLAALLAALAFGASAQIASAQIAATRSAATQRMTSASARVAPARLPATPSLMRNATVRSDFTTFRHFHHRNPNQSLFYPFGIFSDFTYPDTASAESGSQAAPTDLLLQALSALTANQPQSAAQPPSKPDSHSLLIELQGNRYVSLTSSEPPANSQEQTIAPSALKPAPKRSPQTDSREKPATTRELMPVTLLFRDGHYEDIRDYTIANGIIYARGDFYNDGYWNKKIELSALDLPETVKSNEARGIRFVLPNAPNEVITRP